jgi:tRNA G18 (ribose-2'-O)-methylase SpoU
MVFRVPLVRLGNVNYTIDVLTKMAFRSYALEMNGESEIATEPFDAPAIVVVGNEGDGIRQKTMERCDVKLRIPMDPRCESLNASVSAAVVLYAWSAKHPDVLGIAE